MRPPVAEAVVRLYGLSVRIRATTPEDLGALIRVVPGLWRPSSARAARSYALVPVTGLKRKRYVLYRDEEQIARGDLVWVLAVFAGSVGFYVASSSRTRAFVHAGVVGWRGRAILLPGRESTGKTTLTAALLRAGASYMSDEFAPIDDRGRVDPFPRPLTFKRASARRPSFVSAESLGGKEERRSLPAGLVVFTPYVEARRWRPRRLTPGRAILELLKNTVSTERYPGPTLARLDGVVSSVPVLMCGRGEAEATAPLILERLEAELDRVERTGA